MTTDKEILAALVEALDNLTRAEARHESECVEYERRMAAGIIPTGTHADQIGYEVAGLRKVVAAQAANAREAIKRMLQQMEKLEAENAELQQLRARVAELEGLLGEAVDGLENGARILNRERNGEFVDGASSTVEQLLRATAHDCTAALRGGEGV